MSNGLQSLVDYPMVKVPGGEIDLRDDRTTSKWKVAIQPFLLARYPVTKELYYAISQKSSISYDGDQNPVVNISWNDAISFCTFSESWFEGVLFYQ